MMSLAWPLFRVTEQAALAAWPQTGCGDKNKIDGLAVTAMRQALNDVAFRGRVVIGEGEIDHAPMLWIGEEVGKGDGPEVDIAVDPIEGTRPLAYGLWNSISTVALAPRGTMFNPGPFVYMNKIAVGPVARHAVDIDAPVSDNLNKVAKAKGVKVEDLTVVVLDRPRHQELITQIRMAGARIKLIPDGDVAGALMTSMGDNTADLLMGVGGTPEGVLAAAGLRCMGGEIIGKLYPRNQRELDLAKEMGVDFEKPLTMDDLISSDNVFFAATGITTGDYLRGVTYFKDGARTDSVVMRGLSGTVRRVISTHKLSKLMRISSIKYK